MTPEQFTYWLQGFMEVMNPSKIEGKHLEIIKDHLKTVFKKETPNRETFDYVDKNAIPFKPENPFGDKYDVIC